MPTEFITLKYKRIFTARLYRARAYLRLKNLIAQAKTTKHTSYIECCLPRFTFKLWTTEYVCACLRVLWK